jgi:hypothetical protein
MPSLSWVTIRTYTCPPGPLVSPWLPALLDLGDFTVLRLETKGEWTPLAGLPSCTPDGLPGTGLEDARLLLTDCAVGALIGRIGGSSASLKSAGDPAAGDTKPFPIGTFAVVRVPEKATGPLFVGVNVTVRPVQITALEVTISGARG